MLNTNICGSETVAADSRNARSFNCVKKSMGESVAMVPQVRKIHC